MTRYNAGDLLLVKNDAWAISYDKMLKGQTVFVLSTHSLGSDDLMHTILRLLWQGKKIMIMEPSHNNDFEYYFEVVNE